MDLIPFKNLIKDKCGFLVDSVKEPGLVAGIQNRMSKNDLDCHTKYYNYLFQNQKEFQSLITLLTINETYFFREPGHYRLFSEQIIPELLIKRNHGTKINILSAGCSIGDEPYSLVMALMEKYGEGMHEYFTVTGADIDEGALSKAKKGIFSEGSFRSLDNNLKKKYFREVGDNQYEIMKFIKDSVKLQNLNLLSDCYSDSLQKMDVIFYRNVSIYFDFETQKNIFRKLSQILNDKGYIIVSSTETFLHNVGILSLIERDGIYLYQKNPEIESVGKHNISQEIEKISLNPKHQSKRSHDTEFQSKPHRPKTIIQKPYLADRLAKHEKQNLKTKPTQKRKDSHVLFEETLLLVSSKKNEEALNTVNKLREYDKSIKGYNLKASILINLLRLEEAKEVCLKAIELDQWNLEGYLLLGLIAKKGNDKDGIIKRFKEAIYIQPSSWLAHFYLAEVYYTFHELKRACREFEIVIGILEKGDAHNHGLTYLPFKFPEKQLIHLCSHKVEIIKKRL
ncbi:MAG: CheR family methyltransferase [Candidatus Scalindua sp.]